MEQDCVKTRVLDINATTYMLETFQRNAMIIFNHEKFKNEKRREGTKFDEGALKSTFEQFRFDVTVRKDLEKTTLFAELQQFSEQNFEECGCVCVAVLTHGSDHGFLKAFDVSYSERELFACFDATKNPSLAGKPIIFLIQACRGPNLADPVHVPGSEGRPAIELDADIRRVAGYFLPTESDIVIFHSCFFGRASVRETNKGTWFIQATCEQINQHASAEHLEKIFRRVRNIVALEKEHAHAKQMPVMTSTLLRKLFLKRHGEKGHAGVLQQRVDIKKEARIAACPSCYPRLIETYFESTTIVRGISRQLQYCNATRPKRSIDMNHVIDLYKTQEHVYSCKYSNPNSPTTEHGVLIVSGGRQLPLYEVADIKRHHLLSQSEPEFEKDINEHMKLMGRLNTDQKGYLLHPSLGGSSRNINVIPMARDVHQRPIVATDGWVINESILPRSFWKSNEDWIRKFLNTYPNGRVAWRIAVQYEEGVITNPENFINYRPTSFSLQYTAYTHQNDNISSYYISPQTTFRNDNSNNTCGDKLPQFDLAPNVPEGRFGSLMSRGVWPSAHQMCFPYTIQDRTYFYGQSLRDGRIWFIQELLPYGQMGERISRGYWEYEYQLVFPFVISGRQFFYGHNHNTKLWVIQELLPDGKMGEETGSGQWNQAHQVAFPFSINGVHYFFGQSIFGRWFVKELLPGGKIGKETCVGTWDIFYEIVFPFEINNRHYFYRHSHGKKSWFIQELLPGGKLGQETTYGFWQSAHRVTVPYAITGKHYFFGQKIENGKWYIQELRPNGRMGYEISIGEWTEQYSVAFTFSINGGHYLYGHCSETCSWFIKEVL